jgi:OOP family OmpA-OmpF porin
MTALAVITCPLAIADDYDGWYVGGNVGQSHSDIDNARTSESVLGAGSSSTIISEDNKNTGYKVFGGYQYNRNLGIEGGYFDMGEFDYKANSTAPTGTSNGNMDVQGLNLDLVGTLPVTEKFSVLGRIGATYTETEGKFSGTAAAPSNRSEREGGYKYGVGMQYDFTESLAMRAEVERYRVNDAVGNDGDVDLYSVGLVYRFGGSKYVAPVAVAAAPMPEPEVVRVPEPRRVSFSADSLFDFNRETIKPAGKQDLDQFAADLRGSDYGVITVTGHTDRIGGHDYNIRLSERRADAVKSYLVESGGIPANKIMTKGINGAEPVTKPGDCVGDKKTQALIDCLAPDRRVEVEVTGTK